MVHVRYRAVLVVWLCAVLLGHAARAEEGQPLRPCVLVLPLQASPTMSGDQVFLGLAVQNVLENMLVVHSALEECWAVWFSRQLFPHPQALHDWVQGTGDLPAAIPALGLRYLLTGQVRLQGQEVQITVELLDRATGHRLPGTFLVDFPTLEALRTGFIKLLAHAGLPVPATQQPKMLWPEDLSLAAFTLLGQGLAVFVSAFSEGKQAVFNPQSFAEALQRAPRSYLALNNLGWVVYAQERYTEATSLFEQALALNPAGADAADGMIQSGSALGDERLEETWTGHKARAQGQDGQRAFAQMWQRRGMGAYHNSDYPRAINALEQALVIEHEIKDRAGEGTTLYSLGMVYQALSQYERAIGYYEQALVIEHEVKDRAGEGTTLYGLGRVYHALSQYERAIGYYEQALTIKREVKDRDGEGATLYSLGMVYQALSQYERAIGYYEQVLALEREVKDRDGESVTLNKLGSAYNALSQYERAIDYWKQVLALEREGQDRDGESFTLNELGRAYYELNQYEQAIDYGEQALAITREVRDQDGERITLNNLGRAYNALRQYERAVDYWEQALALEREVKDRVGESVTLNDLGRAYNALRQYEQAIDYWKQALAITREVKDRAGEGTILSNLGSAYNALSQHERAIDYGEQALALQHEIKNRAGESVTLSDLGKAYNALSQYERAIDYWKQALVITREGQDRDGEGTLLSNLGTAYSALSQYERAIDYREKALVLQREIKDRDGEGTTLSGLGAVYSALSQYERAIEYYKQALVLHREVKDRGMEGTTLNNLGVAYKALSQYERAIEYNEQALAITREVRDRYGEGVTLSGLGASYYALSQYERAIEYNEQALAITREVKHRAGEGTVLNDLGVIYSALNQYERAIEYYEQALMLHREVKHRAGEGTTLHNLMSVWEIRQASRLAIFYGKQAVNAHQAIRNDIRTLEKVLQQSFLTSKTDTYRDLADLLITAGRLPEAQQILDLLKAEEYFDFIRRDSQAAGRMQPVTLTPEETAWEQRYRTIADRVTAFGAEKQTLLDKASRTTEDNERLDALDQDLTVAKQAFQEFLGSLQEAFRGTPETHVKLAEVEQSEGLMSDLADLGPGTVALYTLVSEQAYRVILITPEARIARSSPIAAKDLNHKVQNLRNALRTSTVDPRPLAQDLYQILVAPVAKDLQGAQAQTLMWSLYGVLRYLPVAALHDGEAYLVERYRHVLFTPESKARLKEAPQTTWKGLGLGVSQAHGAFAALPSVVQELRGIIRDDAEPTFRGVLPGTVKLDAAFTALAMRTALRDRYPVVHIASHFQFRPGNETASFLLLGDGSHLPLSEIKTWPNVFAGVDLLTLSACDTAMGSTAADGKEVEGFGVMAQKLGAKAVVATLWPVADVSTTVFMQELYRRHKIQPGMPKIEALRQAQLALLHGQQPTSIAVPLGERGLLATGDERKDNSTAALPRFSQDPRAPYAHPYYWAPFILIGNWK